MRIHKMMLLGLIVGTVIVATFSTPFVVAVYVTTRPVPAVKLAPLPEMNQELRQLIDVNRAAKGDKAGGVTRVQKKAPTVVPPPPPPARNLGGMRYA